MTTQSLHPFESPAPHLRRLLALIHAEACEDWFALRPQFPTTAQDKAHWVGLQQYPHPPNPVVEIWSKGHG